MNYLKLAGVGAIVAALLVSHGMAYNKGVTDVTLNWDASIRVANKKLNDLNELIREKDAKHAEESASIDRRLAEAETNYRNDLDTAARTYHDRLQHSEARADRYAQLAAAGPAQCEHLASHASKLDRALEEGLNVVQELSRLVEQRDTELRLLGEQILTDRSVISDKNQ